ncbi:hypothetical protein KAR91_07740 [Candidatus Pacearchaeota archaeon]|nr:hypothetical protein [Candidatus Pacearchaeota archaeon]
MDPDKDTKVDLVDDKTVIVTEDKDKTVIDKGQLTPEELLKTVEEAGMKDVFDSVIKDAVDKKLDRRVTQAIKTHDAKKAKEAEELAEKDKADKAKLDKEKTMSDEQKIIAKLQDDNTELKTMFKEFMGKTKKESLDKLKIEALETAKMKPSLASRILTTDPDKIEAEVAELKAEILDIQQTEIDKRIEEQKKPLMGQIGSEAEADAKFEQYFGRKVTDTAKGTIVASQLVKKN